MPFRTLALAALLSAFSPLAADAQWSHYRGPAMNGTSPESISAQFPAAGPRLLWKADVGTGTSAVVVSGGRAFTMGNAGNKDSITCLDAKSGKVVWRHEFPLKLDANMFEGGPRSTPTVDGNRVYAVSHEGDLWCLDAATGKKVWYAHFQKDFGGRRPGWGFSGSPTAAGNLLVCDVGGPDASTVAFDKATGSVAWKSGGDMPGYASPVIGNVAGVQTVVILKADHLVGYDLKSGRELWRSEWKTSYDVNAATPLLVGDDKVFITSGYNAGCALVQVAGGKAMELWRNKALRSQINTPALWQGHAYGIDGNVGGGNLTCLDLASGTEKWEDKSVKGGSVIVADGKLIVLTEKGELVTCDATPAGFKPLARAKVLGKRCWVQPTLAEGRLFLKNNEGELLCVDVAAK